MTEASETPEPVPEEEFLEWVVAAHTARLARYVLDRVGDPRPGSELSVDDAAYRWEKCTAWLRSYLMAASDHLLLWADIIAPQQVFPGQTVQNPPRPFYTLARAGLESAAQAVWVLEQDNWEERVHRHLRLLYHDFRQLALAFEAQGDDRAQAVRERMSEVETRLPKACSFTSIAKGEPKYSTMVRECAPAIDMQPNELETIWRGASAAAHGKNWFHHVGYHSQLGEEYEPGYFRMTLRPNPAEITRAAGAAVAMLTREVDKFADRCGYDRVRLRQEAFAELRNRTPMK